MDEVWLSQHMSVRQASSERKRWTRLSGDLQLSWSHKISACLGMIYSLLHTSTFPKSCLSAGYFLGVCGAALTRVTWERWRARNVFSRLWGWLVCHHVKRRQCVALWFCQPRLLNWIKSVFKFLIKLAVLLVFVAWTPDWVKQWDNTANGDAAQTQEAQRWGRAETCLPTRSCDDALRHHLH